MKILSLKDVTGGLK